MRPFATSLLSVFGLFTAQTNALELDTQSMTSVPVEQTVIEYQFSKKRCTNKQATNPKFGQPSLCETWCEGDDDPTIGCSWSFPIGDPLKNKSDDAACRCNQRLYKYSKKPQKNDNKCDNLCEEDEQCHNSWPFYIQKPTKADKQFRCKGPLPEESDDEEEPDIPDESEPEIPDESEPEIPDESEPDTPVEEVEPTLLETAQCGQSDFNDVQLCMHNQGRALHQDTDPLTLNQNLAADAQAWSDYLAANGLFEHSTNNSRPGQGENLAIYYGGNRHDGWSAKAWYDEIEDYDYDNPAVSFDSSDFMVGHFTQMVWTDTQQVGCGEAAGTCPSFWNTTQTCYYITCRYSPAGNSFFVGQKEEGLIEHVKPQIPQAQTVQSVL